MAHRHVLRCCPPRLRLFLQRHRQGDACPPPRHPRPRRAQPQAPRITIASTLAGAAPAPTLPARWQEAAAQGHGDSSSRGTRPSATTQIFNRKSLLREKVFFQDLCAQ
jgi:hypothetical protein